MTTERLITKSELASEIDLSERCIDNYRQRGLPTHWVAHKRITPQPRFMLSEVKAWLKRERDRAIKEKQG